MNNSSPTEINGILPLTELGTQFSLWFLKEKDILVLEFD